jgi:hypothetical protein
VPGVFVAGDATTVPFKRSSLWQATVPRQRCASDRMRTPCSPDDGGAGRDVMALADGKRLFVIA